MQVIDTSAVSAVVSFLTDDLAPLCSSLVVDKLRCLLKKSLQRVRSLSLSPYRPPPRPVHDACMSTGLPWPYWILLLGNQDIHITITPLHVQAQIAARTVALWDADADLHASNVRFIAGKQIVHPRTLVPMPIRVPTPPDLAPVDSDSDSDTESTSSYFSDVSLSSVTSVSSAASQSTPYPRRPKRLHIREFCYGRRQARCTIHRQKGLARRIVGV
ncbi:uncharacterized protein EV420DRAFT_1526803 [Desarmillaria tabescens]|uniref:Uncharacterized protein n=1 Tax=Armillaria tabescens TaxID=1929756 RepID=A0AA39TRT9_ARMTA|nr:uncharacterized protein EV420DRAFT_1526803 [Desarmillaria tabescens]KAK0461714.1 hypothetical protein EV420DRAFT_1526803 [Desarmillaria tabescens]